MSDQREDNEQAEEQAPEPDPKPEPEPEGAHPTAEQRTAYGVEDEELA